MGFFSNIDTALSEKRRGRGRELPTVGGFGTCLDDSGNPPIFWVLQSITGDIGTFAQSDNPANVQQFPLADFWQLV